MRGEEVILLNFPISHFLKSLAHSALVCPLPGADSLFAQFRLKLFVLQQLCIAIQPILTISDQSFFSNMHLTHTDSLVVFYIWPSFCSEASLRPALHIWIKAKPLTKFYQSSKPTS